MDDLFPKLPADFGRYRILRKLGEGGMGAVYLAEDTNDHDCKTAIKIPIREMDEAGNARFEREAKASAILRHQYICPISNWGQIERRPYLAMEFVEGSSLHTHVGNGKLWPTESAISLILKLAEAFKYAHDKGVIHRDIKPANIMLKANGDPVIMDFGLAKLAGEATLTEAGAVFGTPHYMPIEQARGDIKEIGPHSDVYSLAVVLFQLLSGQLPFTGATPLNIITRIALDPNPPLRQFLPDADEQLDAVLSKAMAKQVKDRYPTMRQFADALAGCRVTATASLPVYPHSVGEVSLSVPMEFNKTPVPMIQPMEEESPTTRSTMQNRRPSRGKFVWLALLAMLVIGVAVMGLQQDGTPKERIAVVTPPTKATTQPSEETKPPSPVPTPEVKKEPEKSPPMPTVVPMVIPKPAPLDNGEKSVEFEYAIDGVKMKGTCRVLTLDIGGGQTMEFVRISKGKFTMGSHKNEAERAANEEREEVTIDKDFYMARYETTQAQYQAIMGKNPSSFKGDRLPVEMVSWDDAKEYCTALSKKLGRTVTLPTEAEWECACRAGTTTPCHFGSKLNGDLANCRDEYPYGAGPSEKNLERTVKVGSYPANPWGLCDMHGNVREWCEDKYSDEGRVVRGGSWHYPAGFCRSAYREYLRPDVHDFDVGFRVCVVSVKKEQEKSPPATLPMTTLVPIVIPKPAPPDNGEKSVEFEYVIDGVKKKGTCRILTLDIGGGQTMEFVRVSKGKFTMGSPKDEEYRDTGEDQKEVTIDKDFYLARYETTQAQYQAVKGNPSNFEGDRLPVETVSWDVAKQYCTVLSNDLGRTVTLPTEAQWEYACRAGTTTPFHFGSKLNGDLANCAGISPYGTDQMGKYHKKTVDVGSYPANPWGLFDMHGNIWEWCEDKNSNERRILRGGSWGDRARDCRSAYRDDYAPNKVSHTFGFRLCVVLD